MTVSIKNVDIENAVRNAIENNKELHLLIYDDGVWKISLERHLYGAVRYWVSTEYRNNRENKQGLCTVSTKCSYVDSEFELKESVSRKILSVEKALRRAKLVII